MSTTSATERKVILVTGGNKGIGFEVVRQLAAGGATVLLGARDPQRGEDAARKLQQDGRQVRSIVIDVADPETAAAAAASIEQEFGRLDVLVNNAGI